MSYIQKSLIKDEVIVKDIKHHWILKFWIVLFIVIAPITFFISLFFALWMLIAMMTVEQAVTNKRVILKKGFIARTVDEIRLDKIEAIEINEEILGRLFGYGKIRIIGANGSFVLFEAVSNPLELKKQIEEMMEVL